MNTFFRYCIRPFYSFNLCNPAHNYSREIGSSVPDIFSLAVPNNKYNLSFHEETVVYCCVTLESVFIALLSSYYIHLYNFTIVPPCLFRCILRCLLLFKMPPVVFLLSCTATGDSFKMKMMRRIIILKAAVTQSVSWNTFTCTDPCQACWASAGALVSRGFSSAWTHSSRKQPIKIQHEIHRWPVSSSNNVNTLLIISNALV